MPETLMLHLLITVVATLLVYRFDARLDPTVDRVGRLAIPSAGFAASLALVIVVATQDIVTVRWFEDDALITFRYARNIAEGCGWEFNCGADDFATSSFLHTLIGSVWFLLTDGDHALALEKVWESLLVISGAGFLASAARTCEIRRGVVVAAIGALLLSENPFLYLFSGMENALAFCCVSVALFLWCTCRRRLLGMTLGGLALVRPEYIVLAPIIVAVDLFVIGGSERLNRRIRAWIGVALAAFATVLPIIVVVWVMNGTLVSDSLEIKQLTAPNWGAYYHEELWRHANDFRFGLLLIAAGTVGLFLARSRLVVLPLFGMAVSIVYWWLGLPRSPWYYLPFFLGLSSSVFGLSPLIDWTARRFNWQMSSWTLRWRALTSSGLAVALLLTLVGNPMAAGRDNVQLAKKITLKRTEINRHGGEWLARTTDSADRIAVPNIGYFGFYSDRFIVDLVGLVTPEASLRVSKTAWFDLYEPEVYLDKLRVDRRLLALPGYSFAAVLGPDRYKDERFLVLRRSDLVADGSSALHLVNSLLPETATGLSQDAVEWWSDIEGGGLSHQGGASLESHLWAVVESTACEADASSFLVQFESGQMLSFDASYVKRLGEGLDRVVFRAPDPGAERQLRYETPSRIGIRCPTGDAESRTAVDELGIAMATGE